MFLIQHLFVKFNNLVSCSFVLGGINLTNGYGDTIDLEGTISSDKKNDPGNDLNVIMRIKIIPQREKFGIEISFSNHFSQDSYLARQIEREILPSNGFRFESK